MIEVKKHCILNNQPISDALHKLNGLGQDLTLFVVTENEAVVGTITDGDIRRGLLKKHSLQDRVELIMRSEFSFLKADSYNLREVESIRERGVNILPVLDAENRIVKLLNLSGLQTILPMDVVIMAGGEGRRMRPLTESTPKSLLTVGDKPIIEHTIDHLIQFGVENFWISTGYLSEQIENYLKDGSSKGIRIKYIKEDRPEGTIGAVGRIPGFHHDHVLVMNSDILTNIDYQKFYQEFLTTGADLSVATIPYSVNVPYAVLETANGHVMSFKEKPTYVYYSNGGIYLIKKDALNFIPDGFFNATDLMEKLIQVGSKVTSYPLRGYWLDIGSPEDYAKANEDIKHLKL